MNNIQVVEHNDNWIHFFEQEESLIKCILQRYIKKIYHIGSTSIPNMPSKPIIDILIAVTDLDFIALIEKKLIQLNYSKLNRSIIPYRSFFTSKTQDTINYNCHIYESGDPQVIRHCRFRDYLISHEKEATAYASLKQQLAAQYPTNIMEYAKGKNAFVRSIDKKAKKIYGANINQLNVSAEVQSWKKEKIIYSMIANYNLYLTHFMQYLTEVEFIRIPGYLLVDTNIFNSHFNYIADNHFKQENTLQIITQHMNYFKERNLPFSWIISPFDHPTNLSQILSENKQTINYLKMGVCLDLSAWQVPSIACSSKVELLNSQSQFSEHLFKIPMKYKHVSQYLALIADVYTTDDPIIFYVFYYNNIMAIYALVLYAQLAGIYPVLLSAEPHEELELFENEILSKAKKFGFKKAVMQVDPLNLPLYFSRGFIQLKPFEFFEIS